MKRQINRPIVRNRSDERARRGAAGAKKRAAAFAVECLEGRVLLSGHGVRSALPHLAPAAAVTDTWISSASGKWSTPGNWSLGAMPMPGQDAVINVPGITVKVDVSANVASIQSSANLDVLYGLTLTSGASSVTGALTLEPGTLLVAQGPTTTVSASAATTADDASLYAQGGATVIFPSISSYPGPSGGPTLEADGTGSMLSLPNLSNVNGSFTATAATGGTVSLPLISSLTQGAHSLVATTGGSISIPKLTTSHQTSIHTDGTGMITTGQIATLISSQIQATGGSMPNYQNLTDADNTSVYAQSGSVITLPGITRYPSPSGGPTLEADGAGSILSMPNLSNIDGTVTVTASSGGMVNLPLITSLTQGAHAFNASAGGSISIPNLTSAQNTFFHTDGTGAVTTSQLTSLTSSQIQATGGSMPNYQNLTDADSTSVYAQGGSVISLPGITRYPGPTGGPTLEADGTGSILSLPNLSNVDGTFTAAATSGGMVNLPQIANFTQGSHSLYASGGGSILIPKLTAAQSTSLHTDGTGTITTIQLTSLTGSQIQATGGSMPNYQNLTDADNTSVYAQGGSVISLPGITRYAGPTGGPTIEADGTGSLLSLPNLSNVDGTFTAIATSGGMVNLPQIASFTQGSHSLYATGGGSISIPKLTSAQATTVHTDGAGTITTSQITSLTASQILASGGSMPNYQNLTDADNTSVYAQGGSIITLAGITRYPGPTGGPTVEADGTGSLLSLPNLSNVDGTFTATATSGGTVNLPQIASFTQGSHSLYASGGGSISIPKLTSAQNTAVHTDGTGMITTSQLTSLTGSQILASGGSTPNFQGLTDADFTSVFAQGGSVVTLPGITRSPGMKSSATYEADGAGSMLSLPNLTNVDGNLTVTATSNGSVSLPLVTNLTQGSYSLSATGGGSISIPMLASITDGNTYVDTSGTITTGPNLTLNAGQATINRTGTLSTQSLTLLSGATLIGGGTINANVNNSEGTVNVASSAGGIFTINGNYIQAPCGTLEIYIGGANPGSGGYNQLKVSGSATLSGTLELVNPYVPALGTLLNILPAGSSSGFFTSQPNNPSSGQNIQLDPLYAGSGPNAGVTLRADSIAGPSLVSTTIGDGTSQRSEVRQLTVKFSGPVTLSPGAFTLGLLNEGGSGTNSPICTTPTDATAALGQATTTDGGTSWIIPILRNSPFSDSTGSLSDGIYTLTVHGANVSAGGLMLHGWDQTTEFHRLFGDINGDKTVNNIDYFQFNKAFNSTTGAANFNPNLDYNGDGKINNNDYFQFNKRFGKTLTY